MSPSISAAWNTAFLAALSMSCDAAFFSAIMMSLYSSWTSLSSSLSLRSRRELGRLVMKANFLNFAGSLDLIVSKIKFYLNCSSKGEPPLNG